MWTPTEFLRPHRRRRPPPGAANLNYVQTTLIPAGGAVIAEFHTVVPGSFVMVDRSIFRVFNQGAAIKVDGPDNRAVYSGKEVDSVYLGDKAGDLRVASQAAASSEQGTLSLDQQIKAGGALFTASLRRGILPLRAQNY